MEDMTQKSGPTEIVLTGGPCAGKSSALKYLVEHLSARGWRALVVPEAATMLIGGGIHDMGHFAVNDRKTFLKIQENLMLLQNDLRNRFLSLAQDMTSCDSPCNPDCDTTCHELHHEARKQIHDPVVCNGQVRTVLIYDRAELDNQAYMNETEFEQVLSQAMKSSRGAVSAQYDAVVHLVTAADGAAEFYTTANNEARFETVEQAVELDKAVQAAWLGHPHLTVVANEGDFERKLSRTLAAVLNILGEPEPVEIERKWLLDTPPDLALLGSAVPVLIEQIYLPDEADGTERRVRARTHDGHTTFFYTTKAATDSPTGRLEHESVISGETYRHLAGMRAEGTHIVRKTRYCFVHAGQHFELDHLTEPLDVWLLEAELVSVDDEVTLPESLDIFREVTDDPQWRNGALARM